MIYFDLDGVLRNLSKAVLGFEPYTYFYKNKNGETIIDLINKDLRVLVESPVTEYFNTIINELEEIHIISAQHEHWKPYTLQWLYKNFKEKQFHITYAKPQEKPLLLKNNNDYLVEDYPFFEDFSKIIIIDRLYNRCIQKPHIRIKNTLELQQFLKKFK